MRGGPAGATGFFGAATTGAATTTGATTTGAAKDRIFGAGGAGGGGADSSTRGDGADGAAMSRSRGPPDGNAALDPVSTACKSPRNTAPSATARRAARTRASTKPPGWMRISSCAVTLPESTPATTTLEASTSASTMPPSSTTNVP